MVERQSLCAMFKKRLFILQMCISFVGTHHRLFLTMTDFNGLLIAISLDIEKIKDYRQVYKNI